MPLSASNEELQHLAKNKVLAGALEKDGGQGDLSLLPVGPFRGILHLVLQIHAVGTEGI